MKVVLTEYDTKKLLEKLITQLESADTGLQHESADVKKLFGMLNGNIPIMKASKGRASAVARAKDDIEHEKEELEKEAHEVDGTLATIDHIAKEFAAATHEKLKVDDNAPTAVLVGELDAVIHHSPGMAGQRSR